MDKDIKSLQMSLADLLDEDHDDTSVVLKTSENGPPKPTQEKLANLVDLASNYFNDRHALAELVGELRDVLNAFNPEVKEYTFHDFKLDFLNGHRTEETRSETIYRFDNEISPPSIGLVALEEFFSGKRFLRFDPHQLAPEDIREKILVPDPIHTLVRVGEFEKSVPEGQLLWIYDTQLDCRFIVTYKVGMGGLGILVEACHAERNKARQLYVDIRDYVNTSPYFRGKILELSPNGFQIVQITDPPQPILDKAISEEIIKNVHNIFEKKAEFDNYELPTRRAIILAGPPGTGKTLICRSIAHSIVGVVTTLWVTSKAIRGAAHIAEIFSLARKLSPCFLVFEDIDLISGTREDDAECLGEMLNQLDGLKANESLVVMATTNRVSSLDEALKDRPGRFDRIFLLGKPSPEICKMIAVNFLKKRGIPLDRLEKLNLDFFCEGGLSGAQIEEVVKGGLVEAIFRGCEINDMCLKHSYNGLKHQRKWVMGTED